MYYATTKQASMIWLILRRIVKYPTQSTYLWAQAPHRDGYVSGLIGGMVTFLTTKPSSLDLFSQFMVVNRLHQQASVSLTTPILMWPEIENDDPVGWQVG